MKRRELVKLLQDNGWYIKRNGGNHDIYTDGNRTDLFRDIRILTKDLQKTLLRNWGLNSPGGLIFVSLSIMCVG